MIEVRRMASGEDAAALAALELLAETPPKLPNLTAFLASPRNYVIFGYLDGQPVGYAIAYPLPYVDGRGPILFLWEMGVHERARRRGVGAALLRWLLHEGRRTGCSEMFVVTAAGNEAAMRLYESTGGVRLAEDDVVFVYGLPG